MKHKGHDAPDRERTSRPAIVRGVRHETYGANGGPPKSRRFKAQESCDAPMCCTSGSPFIYGDHQ